MEDEMKITVTLTSWQVPFSQIVDETKAFDSADEALDFINAASKAWWNTYDGDGCARSNDGIYTAQINFNVVNEYKAITSLLDGAHYSLWGGENGFQALIDKESYWQLHAAHYKREYDDKGIPRPGYLRVAMGEDVSAVIAELQQFYKPHN